MNAPNTLRTILIDIQQCPGCLGCGRAWDDLDQRDHKCVACNGLGGFNMELTPDCLNDEGQPEADGVWDALVDFMKARGAKFHPESSGVRAVHPFNDKRLYTNRFVIVEG